MTKISDNDASKLDTAKKDGIVLIRSSPLLDQSPQRGRSPIPPNSPLLQPRTQSPLNSPRTQRRARDSLRKMGSSLSLSSSSSSSKFMPPRMVKVVKHDGGSRCGWKIMRQEDENENETLDEATIQLVAEKIRGLELSGQIVPEFIAV